MAKHGKNYRKAAEGLDPLKRYTVAEAVTEMQNRKFSKFSESVDLVIHLNIDPRQADQNIRGKVVLPGGTGKTVRVLVFTQGDKAKEAEEAGADYVGGEELAAKIQKEGWLEFDACVATPDMMRVVGRLGKVLGPRNMMPNPKVGTVTNDVAQIIGELKGGSTQYRADKYGILHCMVGKVDFDAEKLNQNINVVLEALVRQRPSTVKGQYMKSVTLSSTMGPGFKIGYDVS